VLFPGEKNICIEGFLGLHDKDIAVVTCFYRSDPCSIHRLFPLQQLFDRYSIESLGRAFNSGTLMSTKGHLRHYVSSRDALSYSDCAVTEVSCCIISFILA
jgi:hypothetical protein